MEQVDQVVDHLFRHEYSKWVAILTSKYGTSNLDLIEDAVQESLYKAMRMWSYQGLPDNPSSWLFTVSRNKVIDTLRREQKTVYAEDSEFTGTVEGESPEGIADEQVKMIFACCHPELSEVDQLLLNLKLNFGFGNKEIGKILFKAPDSVKRSITRAKDRFRQKVESLDLPDQEALTGRFHTVTKVVYLIFTNGYNNPGNSLINRDLCEEALRIAGYLNHRDGFSTPELRALIALMCFKLARFDARTDGSGNLLTLEHQNRAQWDADLLNLGQSYLIDSRDGDAISSYHLEAAIEYEYCTAKAYEDIDWSSVLNCYDLLSTINHSPSVKLNRVVVVDQVKGPEQALNELNELPSEELEGNHVFHAVKGQLLMKLNHAGYAKELRKAIELTPSDAEKRFLESLI